MDSLTHQLVAAINARDTEGVDRLVSLIMKEDDARQAKLNATGALKSAAEWYARQGVPVFPCVKRGVISLLRNGPGAATTDAEQIRRWWSRNPYANIGTPTGVTFDVLAVDNREAYTAFAEIQKTKLLGRAVTPSGGMHFYVSPSGEANSSIVMSDDIDYRGVGDYVLLAPSYVVIDDIRAGRYTWTTRPNFKKLVR